MLLATLLFALAGWQGTVQFTHDPPRKGGGDLGAIYVSGESVRIEEPSPSGKLVVLWSGGKLRLLFESSREYLELPPQEAAMATVPPTSLSGMKQVGEETLLGRRCAVWEKTAQTQGGRVRQRVWVPADAKGFVFLRWVTLTDRGATKADVTELKVAPQPQSLFRLPNGYKRKG